MRYVPSRVARNEKEAAWRGGRPYCEPGDAAPGNAGVRPLTPRTIAQEWRRLDELFTQRTVTRQPRGTSTRAWPLPYPLKLKPS